MSPLKALKLFSADVFINNFLNRAVCCQLSQCCVDFFCQRAVLRQADCIILYCIFCIQNFQTFICRNEGFCRVVIDNNAVDFALCQRKNCVCALLEAFYLTQTCTFDVICCIQVTGSTCLYADFMICAFCEQIIHRFDIGAFLYDDCLYACCVGIGKVYAFQTIPAIPMLALPLVTAGMMESNSISSILKSMPSLSASA